MTDNFLDLAKDVLQREAEAILHLGESLDDTFTKTVDLLSTLEDRGRIVVSGMGKAGIIGQKISATFASLGIPSFFLHPAEAVHGDLGRCTPADMTLLLSNSGETSEVLEMIPFIRRAGCPIIALTANNTSTLGRNSDLALEIGSHTEAGDLGLAPTTSTTVMLALGDALAMCLANKNKVSKEEFAKFHPAGSIGRSLLVVSEIMRKDDEVCIVPEDMLCKNVLQSISNTPGRPGAAVIIDSANELSGVFTDGDLRRCLNSSSSFLEDPISDHMSRDPKTISAQALVQEATHLMNELKIDQIIAVDEKKKPIGMLDIQDAVSVKMR